MMQDKKLFNVENPSLESISLAKRFLSASVQIEIFGQQAGVVIRATLDNRLLLFTALPLLDQIEAVKKIEQSCDIFASIVREKKDLGVSFSSVWMACRTFGLRPPSDFFDKLSDDDIVQVYSQEGVHLFSNLKLFEMCSYTLEQIYTIPWHLLWHRAERDMAYLMSCAAQVMNPDQKATLMFNSPPHRTYELSSVFKYESEYRLKCAAPLFDRVTGQRSGFIVCESGRLLTKHTPLEEERMLLQVEPTSPAMIDLGSPS